MGLPWQPNFIGQRWSKGLNPFGICFADLRQRRSVEAIHRSSAVEEMYGCREKRSRVNCP